MSEEDSVSSSRSATAEEAKKKAKEQSKLIKELQARLDAFEEAQDFEETKPKHHRFKIADPTTFDGTKIGNTADMWLMEINQRFIFYDINTNKDRIGYASGYLKDAALLWFTKEVNLEEVTTWPQFADLLRKRYRPVKPSDNARRELKSLRMGMNQDLNAHLSKFRSILSYIENMSEEDMKIAFLDGLPIPLMTKIYENDPTTLKEAIDLAIRHDSIAQMTRRTVEHARGASNNNGNWKSSSQPSNSSPSINNIYGEEEGEFNNSGDNQMMNVLANMMDSRINAIMGNSNNRGGYSGGFQRRNNNSNGGAPYVALDHKEFARRRDNRLCYACGIGGHRRQNCMVKVAKKEENQSGKV